MTNLLNSKSNRIISYTITILMVLVFHGVVGWFILQYGLPNKNIEQTNKPHIIDEYQQSNLIEVSISDFKTSSLTIVNNSDNVSTETIAESSSKGSLGQNNKSIYIRTHKKNSTLSRKDKQTIQSNELKLNQDKRTNSLQTNLVNNNSKNDSYTSVMSDATNNKNQTKYNKNNLQPSNYNNLKSNSLDSENLNLPANSKSITSSRMQNGVVQHQHSGDQPTHSQATSDKTTEGTNNISPTQKPYSYQFTLKEAKWNIQPTIRENGVTRAAPNKNTILRFKVDTKGRIKDVSINPSFGDINADRYIRNEFMAKGKFEPFFRDGVAVSGYVNIPFSL